METATTPDKKHTFVDGKSYTMKYKRTNVCVVYEKQFDWYRVEHVTSKQHDFGGFIMFKDIVPRYNLLMGPNYSNGLLIVTEMSPEEIKEHDAAYNTWEAQQEYERRNKYKKYKK